VADSSEEAGVVKRCIKTMNSWVHFRVNFSGGKASSVCSKSHKPLSKVLVPGSCPDRAEAPVKRKKIKMYFFIRSVSYV
jgi:hypothetical protein